MAGFCLAAAASVRAAPEAVMVAASAATPIVAAAEDAGAKRAANRSGPLADDADRGVGVEPLTVLLTGLGIGLLLLLRRPQR
jgi:hypothetical protein